MCASYRLALAGCCMLMVIAFTSAENSNDFWEPDALVRHDSAASGSTRPQAVQQASSTIAADRKQTDKSSVAKTVKEYPTVTSHKLIVSKAAAAAQKQQQQQWARPAQDVPSPSPGVPSLPGIPLSFYGDTMGRLTKDIRGVYLDLEPQRVLVAMRENGDATQPPSAFTYASRLFCDWTGMVDSVGRCDVSANLLPADPTDRFNRQAIMNARCELTGAARACDPQFASGQIIMGTGPVAVVMSADAATNTTNIRSFSGDVLVDGVYPTGRPDTVLAGLIGFRRGNMKFDVKTAANPITQNSLYAGRVTFSLYKGPF